MTAIAGSMIGFIVVAILVVGPRVDGWVNRWTAIRNRPKHYVEPNGANSPMTVYQAAFSVADRLRAIWENDPRNLERLDALVSILDPRTNYADWERQLSDVQTWPDEPADPEALDDRILWELQGFIEVDCWSTFNPDHAHDAFVKLTAVLTETGIEFPDASNVSFNQLY